MEAREKGFLPKDRVSPHPNTVLGWCGDENVRFILSVCGSYAVQHLKPIEHDFAIDESEFRLTKPLQGDGPKTVHLQVCCGLTTGAFADAMVMGSEPEAKFLTELQCISVQYFNIRSVVADGAYSEEPCYRLIDSMGAVPLIPFDDNSTGKNSGPYYKKWFEVWTRDRKRFDDAMKERKMVKPWIGSLKAKHGRRGELLAKVFCHNVRRAVYAAFEYRIKPEWWPT